MDMEKLRCSWALRSQVEKDYHDEEWGIPSYDESYIFEMLILEGMQAGLSWSTIINKRDNFRLAFDNFNPEKIAEYDDEKVKELMDNNNIIRHELKIRSVIHNAKVYLSLLENGQKLGDYLWSSLDYQPIVNAWISMEEVPSQSQLSLELSKGLKKLGFKFVGPTSTYALMQGIGMVNDHLVSCPFYIKKES